MKNLIDIFIPDFEEFFVFKNVDLEELEEQQNTTEL